MEVELCGCSPRLLTGRAPSHFDGLGSRFAGAADRQDLLRNHSGCCRLQLVLPLRAAAVEQIFVILRGDGDLSAFLYFGAPVGLVPANSAQKIVFGDASSYEFPDRPRAKADADVPMLRRGFVPFLQMEVGASMDESILARENPAVPFQPAETKSTAFQKARREQRIKLPLCLPAEYPRQPVVVPSPGVKIEQRREQAVQLLRAVTNAKTHVPPCFQPTQNGANLRPEPRSKGAQVIVPTRGETNGRTRNRLFLPQSASGHPLQNREVRRRGRQVLELQDYVAEVFVYIPQPGGDDGLFEAVCNDEVEIVRVARAIGQKRERRECLPIAAHCLATQRCDPSQFAALVPCSQNAQFVRLAVCGPPGPRPFPRQKRGSRTRRGEQTVPLRQQLLPVLLRSNGVNFHTPTRTGASTTCLSHSSSIRKVHRVSP